MNIRIDELISIGSCVPIQSLQTVHSIHRHVRNFVYEDQIIALCTKGIAPAPNRIIVSADSLEGIDRVSIGSEEIDFGGQILPYTREMIYRPPSLDIGCSICDLKEKLHILKQEFYHKAPGNCVAMLIQGAQTQRKSFERELGNCFASGEELFRAGKYREAVNCYKGRGYGFTPAGDDFLSGLLIGMSWMDSMQKNMLSEILDAILLESIGNNVLTNSMLHSARTLMLDEDWAGMLIELGTVEGCPKVYLEHILGHGSTSGADELSGFFLGFELYYDHVYSPKKDILW